MKTHRVATLVVLVLSNAALAQEVVPVHEEPRHQLVLERGSVRVLDVQIPPGDTTLYHTHSSPILYVAINSSPTDAQVLGGSWRGVEASDPPAWQPGEVNHDLSYARRPLTHRVRNVGADLFRLIAVTNGASTPPEADANASQLPGVFESSNRWFHQSRLRMAPDSSSDWHSSEHPIVVVQTSQGEAELRRRDTEAELLTEPGSFVFVDQERKYQLRNRGSDPVTLVVVEVRQSKTR